MRKTVLFSILAACAVPTAAEARDGAAYVELGAGLTLADDSEFDSAADPDFDDITVEWGNGFDIAGAAGYDFGAFRAEAEVAFKSHGYDRVLDGATVVLDGDDDVDFDFNTWSVMLNALVDIGPDESVNGFVGGGLGFSGTELDVRERTDGIEETTNDSDSAFAWQLLAGVRVPVSDRIDAGLKYRYFNQSGLGFVISDDDDFNTDFSSHSLLLTLNYNFGG
ncbi:outer membrane protein [Qipengyuania sphaerica]|uniref:outer membrane protein n=1 Tax=Qipengyuania sphaerica TaxID=2867243 RepID=UPI001C87C76F|nr:outer membrane beta-barrel protein [Qipengyuania sphaerica]MBX7540465.1 outer membrane beta-barrel protein [Qipengyuania sphaerica]